MSALAPKALLKIENAHMPERLAPEGKVILETFGHLYPKEVSDCTGKQFAERYPQSVSVGREATYFIPKGRLATLRGKAFAVPRSIIANLRQELSSKDLHNRVYHNKTYPGCMLGSWELGKKREKENEKYAAARSQAGKAREGK